MPVSLAQRVALRVQAGVGHQIERHPCPRKLAWVLTSCLWLLSRATRAGLVDLFHLAWMLHLGKWRVVRGLPVTQHEHAWPHH